MSTLVTGGTGMVGKALQKFMPNAVFVGNKEADLRNKSAVKSLFDARDYDCVIHLAARVGGIIANSNAQYEFFYDNIMINTNVINECVMRRIPRVIAMSSTCAYPANAEIPIVEESIYDGFPERTNFGYAFAKRAISVQMLAAADQFGLQYMCIYSSNLFGPYDCFDFHKSHAIPALIMKISQAKERGLSSVELFGTGKPLRQFTFSEDLGKFLARSVHKYTPGFFNFANPQSLTIMDAARLIANRIGFDGELVFNGKLDGIYKKDVSIDKLQKIYDCSFTDFDTAISLTYKWFIENRKCYI